MAGEKEAVLREWARSMPQATHAGLVEFPPMALVEARPGRRLIVPAPGIEGTVMSWYEDGSIGVVGEVQEYMRHPFTGNELDRGQSINAQCDPAWIVVTGFCMIDGVAIDSAWMRAALGLEEA